jgi:hypothetical protein
MFGFVIFGLGIGMGLWPLVKTTWKYFPSKKGFLTGFILSVFGLCPMVFTSIADAVINPEGEKMNEDHIFRPEIAIKMKDFALIMSITMGVCGILSQILMFPLDNAMSPDTNDDNSNEKKIEDESNEIHSNLKDNENKNESEEKNEINDDKKEPFMQAFKSWRFHLFNFMSVGTLCKYI